MLEASLRPGQLSRRPVLAMPDLCRIYEIDGEQIRIRSGKPLEPHDLEALTEVIRAARRELLADAIRRGPGAEAIRAGRALYRQQRIRTINERAHRHA